MAQLRVKTLVRRVLRSPCQSEQRPGTGHLFFAAFVAEAFEMEDDLLSRRRLRIASLFRQAFALDDAWDLHKLPNHHSVWTVPPRAAALAVWTWVCRRLGTRLFCRHAARSMCPRRPCSGGGTKVEVSAPVCWWLQVEIDNAAREVLSANFPGVRLARDGADGVQTIAEP